MLEELRIKKRRVVGFKETLKALKRGEVEVIFVSKDCDERLREKIVDLAKEEGIRIEEVVSRKVLGELVGIDVGAAVAALIKKTK